MRSEGDCIVIGIENNLMVLDKQYNILVEQKIDSMDHITCLDVLPSKDITHILVTD